MAVVEVPTHAELYAMAKAAALARTTRLSERSFSAGFMCDIITGLSATLAEQIIRIELELHRRTFFRTADGESLDALADDHFALARQAGAKAVGTVTFARPGMLAGTITIPSGTRLSTPDGISFATTAPAILVGLSISAPVEASLVGEAGIVAAGTITQILDPLADGTVTVSNAAATSGGGERESDAAFRERVRGYLATIRRGTVSAIEFGARQVAGVEKATLDEATSPITVYIADVTGTANAALVSAVAAELANWRAAGVQVNVVGATVVEQAITVVLTFRAGYDTVLARDAAVLAIVDSVAQLGIGETLYRSRLIAAAASVPGIEDVTISNPAGDLVPTASQIIRTEIGLVTVS